MSAQGLLGSSYGPPILPPPAGPTNAMNTDAPASGITNGMLKQRQDWIIDDVEFKGKTKTKIRLILKALHITPGRIVKNATLDEIRQSIKTKAVKDDYFVDAEIKFIVTKKNRLKLIIELKEKWTFFPIPAISYSDKKWTLGLGFLEGNFLGTKSQLGMAGVYKDDYLSFTGIWNINRFFIDGLGVFTSFFNIRQEAAVYDGSDKTGSYRHRWTGGLISWRYRLSSLSRIWLRMNVLEHRFDEADNTGLPKNGSERLFDLSYILRKWETIEDHEIGYWMRIAWGMDAGILGSDYHRYMLSWSFHYAINPFKNHNLLINQQGVFAGGLENGFRLEVGSGTNPYTPSILGYKAGQFLADYLIYHGIEYRIPVYSHKYFIPSVVPIFQHMIFKEHNGNWRTIASYGVAVRVYLRRLLLPAISLYVVYPEANKEFAFGAALGASI